MSTCVDLGVHLRDVNAGYLHLGEYLDHAPQAWRNFLIQLNIPRDVTGEHRITIIQEALAPWHGVYMNAADRLSKVVVFDDRAALWAWYLTYA